MTDANAVLQEVVPATVVVPPVAPAGAQGENANAGANNQQPQQAQVVAYQSTFYGGHLPALTGEVGQVINRTVSTAGLKDRAEACFNFLNDPTSDLRDLTEIIQSSRPLLWFPGPRN